jgi:hypothetical protein
VRPGLEDYEPVEARIHRFWTDHPAGRIVTEIVHTNYDERGRIDQVVIRAAIWRAIEDAFPAAIDYAEEIVGASTVNRYSALENACTSATGRALANLGYSPKGARPSREEMAKVSRHSDIDLSTPAGMAELDRAAKADRDLNFRATGPASHKPASEKQLGLVAKLMSDYKIPKEDRNAYAAEVIGRPLDSAADMTSAEASNLITHLKETTAAAMPADPWSTS